MEALRDVFRKYCDILLSGESASNTKLNLNSLLSLVEERGTLGRHSVSPLLELKRDLETKGSLDGEAFGHFYRFVFFICREKGQKNMETNSALEAWKFLLQGKFPLLDKWCKFVKNHYRFAISEDTWRQILEFSKVVHSDFVSYDPAGAWPVLVDDFVECITRKPFCIVCVKADPLWGNNLKLEGNNTEPNDSDENGSTNGKRRWEQNLESQCIEQLSERLSMMSPSPQKRTKFHGDTWPGNELWSSADAVVEGSVDRWLWKEGNVMDCSSGMIIDD